MYLKFLLLIISSTFLFSAQIKPAMLFDADIILDNSWNETIYKGIKKFEKKTDINVDIFNEVDADKAIILLRQLAKKKYNPIIMSYTEYRKDAITEIMKNNPKTRFIILNGSFNMPNAHYISFSYEESSFLVGYIAAKKSKTKNIGFIGGADIPIIRNFLCAYIKGAKFANKDVNIEYTFIGSDLHAFINPDKAYELGLEQIKNGADVLFAPAGHSSLGALKASYEKKVYSIGVDSNQNSLYPGSVLTSAMTRVDNAIFRALMAAKNNVWGSQIKIMGLQEKGIELAFDEHNKELISKSLKEEIDTLTAEIILKKILLKNYAIEKQCIYDEKKLCYDTKSTYLT